MINELKSLSEIHSFSAEQQSTAKPIYPDLSSDTLQMNLNKRNRQPNPSAPKFEDIQLDQNVQPTASPSVQRKSTKTHPMKQEHLANENMFDENRRGSTTENESNGVVFLLDGIEQLRVRPLFPIDCHSSLSIF